MSTYTEHLPLCTGCGIPIDECPESEGEWIVWSRTIPCPAGNPYCKGHTRETRIYCTRCQKEGKHESRQDG